MPPTERVRWGGQWLEVSSGGSTPPSSTISHYDATELSLSDGDPVSTWDDLVGSNDGTGGTSPTFREYVQNGLAMVEFTGSEYLETGYIPDTDDPLTVFIVVESNTQDCYIYGAQDDSGDGNRAYLTHGSSDDYLGGFADNFTRGGTFANNPVVVTLQAEGGTVEVFESDTSISSSTYASQGSVGFDALIGSRNTSGSPGSKSLEGYIGEIIVSGSVSDSERDSVISDLENKWGI